MARAATISRPVSAPSISRRNYEVGTEFVERFIEKDARYATFFTPSKRAGHAMFDLPGLTTRRLTDAGVTAENLDLCTYADEERFFSYRRTTHRSEPDYGRQISAISLRRHDMALHFTQDEFSARLERLTAKMKEEKLAAMLLFAQESMYWLTGYDTFGYCFFQTLVVKADGSMVLLTRSADLRQAKHTSNIERVEVWVDRVNADPTMDLKNLLSDLDLLGARIGIEYDTHGMTGRIARLLDQQLTSFGELVDASLLVSRLRLVKSAAEIIYVEQAASLADDALDAAIPLIHAGGSEAAILAAMQGAVFCRRRRLSGQ